MLSIDEAILHTKEVASRKFDDRVHCIRCSEFHNQLAEWLEELKMYKSLAPRELVSQKQKNDRVIEYSKGFNYGFNTGYNKAIGDFAEKLKAECREHYVDCNPYFGGITDSILYEDDIDKIAEQLKAGGNNDN